MGFGGKVRVCVCSLACVRPDNRTFGDLYTSFQERCVHSRRRYVVGRNM